ncbi:MAG TPA: GNAT family N-acetyltransferase [Chitinophagaceae bacterium]|nr:GNAT family N-acetyltransferase [Chitinophagaceae bacterium]
MEPLSIKGIKTNLSELTESDAAEVVQLRNDPANNKFLFQKEMTVSDQLEWIRKNRNRNDSKNFKVTDSHHVFKGTISIYNIANKRGEFGRYIVTNQINAIEAEYLLLKICFEMLELNAVYCQTNMDNKTVWGQHVKLGFKETAVKEVPVGSFADVMVKAVVQEITVKEFRAFNYEKVMKLIKFF